MKLSTAAATAVLLALPILTAAQDAPTPAPPNPDVVTIHLKDGSALRARIIDQNETRISLVTVGGLAMEITPASVDHIDREAAATESAPRPSDSNYTRLLFSPTGRPLGKGEGYFSDHYVVFPSVAYGLTDNLSIGAGVSVIPGVPLGEQLLYVSPRFGKQFSDRVAISTGILFAHAGAGGEDSNLGVGFAMATLGKPDKSLTIGGGVVRTVEYEYRGHYEGRRWVDDSRYEPTYTPLVVVGGTVRLSHRVALISENWLILRDDFKISEQPFAVGVRFLGDRLSADVGLVLVGELLDEGLPAPWLSVTYHFGKSK
jgi:hypothetical protein